LGDLRNQSSTLGTASLNNSKWNLKSMSSSDNQACFLGSYSDLENPMVSNSTTDLVKIDYEILTAYFD
jgi:hypothetical protein